MRPAARSPLRSLSSVLSLAFAATALVAVLANAQTGVSDTTPDLAAEASPISTTLTLTSNLNPTTPWPVFSATSPTTVESPHDLLAYIGVETGVRKLVEEDYATWQSHFNGATRPSLLPSGLLTASGCLSPCNLHKSLLVVNPTAQRVYAAMVTEGKVAMWPSLMSWPDEAIPTLKTWLAQSTEDDD